MAMLMLLIIASVCAAQPTFIQVPKHAVEGQIVYGITDQGNQIRFQVPQGYENRTSSFITSTSNRGLIIPNPTKQEEESLQVHLHHTSQAGSIAISWTTPSHCTPTIVLNSVLNSDVASNVASDVLQNGTTRSYPTARLPDNTTAYFQHVVLTQLNEGSAYNYTIACDGYGTFSSTFVAPTSSLDNTSMTIAIFGDMGVSNAAHDTVRSMLSQLNDESNSNSIAAVFHIGDLSYARSNEDIWNQFFGMIEPIASRVPWTVSPGNHDMRKGDSAGECGLPMLSRFETPRSRAAQPHLLSQNSTVRCNEAYNNTVGHPFWYTVKLRGYATIITYSTDSNLEQNSEQWNWLQSELKKANTIEERGKHPWIFLMGHKPMYTASTYGGCISTRDNPESGEGTEGQLTHELEKLFVDHSVDVSFYGHIHSYNRMYPTKQNGTYVEDTNKQVYRNPKAPVHMMVGMSGAGHLGASYDKPSWSAYSEISYGWLKTTFANRTALHLEFVANGDGLEGEYAPSVHDEVWIVKDGGGGGGV